MPALSESKIFFGEKILMKIAFCIENFKPARGGAERYVYDLSHLLCERGHKVHIYTLSGVASPEDNLFIHKIRVPRRPKFIRTICFATRSRQRVKEQPFDVIHSFGRSWGMDVFQPLGGSQMASLVGNIRSIPSIFGKLLKGLSYLFSLRRFIYFLVEWVQMREARTVIAISAVVTKDLIHYNHLRPDKVRIVRNGVDLEEFNVRNRAAYREETRRELQLNEHDILMLFVAHNFRLKGLLPLILALAYLKRVNPEIPFKLAILGEERIKRKALWFEKFARKTRVKEYITFIGAKEHTPPYYAAADICVHPSFYDPSALVVMEAMASGLPVITTTYCGTSEIIEDGKEGYVVGNPNNISELADRILRLKDDDRRNFMGGQARRRAEEFSYARNMREILEIYNEYLGTRSRP